jgi:hypothetical protein
MERDPVKGTPFEFVKDELGNLHLQCMRCLGHAKGYDELAYNHIRSQLFGRLRLILLTPWYVKGVIKFMIKHRECL